VTVRLTHEKEAEYLQRAASMCMGEDDFDLIKTVNVCLASDLGYDNVVFSPEAIYDSTTDFIDEIPEYDKINDMAEPAIMYMANQENVSV
jgi:hypothetical protein